MSQVSIRARQWSQSVMCIGMDGLIGRVTFVDLENVPRAHSQFYSIADCFFVLFSFAGFRTGRFVDIVGGHSVQCSHKRHQRSKSTDHHHSATVASIAGTEWQQGPGPRLARPTPTTLAISDSNSTAHPEHSVHQLGCCHCFRWQFGDPSHSTEHQLPIAIGPSERGPHAHPCAQTRNPAGSLRRGTSRFDPRNHPTSHSRGARDNPALSPYHSGNQTSSRASGFTSPQEERRLCWRCVTLKHDCSLVVDVVFSLSVPINILFNGQLTTQLSHSQYRSSSGN